MKSTNFPPLSRKQLPPPSLRVNPKEPNQFKISEAEHLWEALPNPKLNGLPLRCNSTPRTRFTNIHHLTIPTCAYCLMVATDEVFGGKKKASVSAALHLAHVRHSFNMG